jgi:hypothetical protein
MPRPKHPKAIYSRKQHFTRHIRGIDGHALETFTVDPDYLKLPRKLKKVAKGFAKGLYYDRRKGVCIFNPKLLSTPVPRGMLHIFENMPKWPVNGGVTMRFQRYNGPVSVNSPEFEAAYAKFHGDEADA